MLRSLFSAVSGLQSHQLEIDVIGNNIANINTTGFKSGRVTFDEVMAQTLRGAARPTATSGGTNPMQIGRGAMIAAVDSLWGQGQILTTGRATDLAIEGEGFFMLSAGGNTAYTRSGVFNLGADGRLLASNGYVVQGYLAAPGGVLPVSGSPGDITLPLGRVAPATATTSMTLQGNLNARDQAVGSILTSRRLLATAQGTDDVHALFDGNGLNASLGAAGGVLVRANASPTTLMLDLSNEDGKPLGLVDGMLLEVRNGASTVNLTFDDTWTWSDFASQLETTLNTMGGGSDISVTVQSDGSLHITNGPGGSPDLLVTVQNPSVPNFNQLVNEMVVLDGGATQATGRAFYRRLLTDGVDFDTMEQLASRLEESLQHVSSGVTVSFTGGAFQISNASGSDLDDVTVSETGTGTAFGATLDLTALDLAVGETASSGAFLHRANDSDLLLELRNAAGVSLGLSDSDLLSLQGNLGGAPIVPTTLQVSSVGDGADDDRTVTTLGGLTAELGNIFSISAAGSVEIDGQGFLIVRGDPGVAESLTGVSLSHASSTTFTEAFRFAETQAATDVTHSASLAAYDSLGETHVVSITFTKSTTVPNEWRWQATVGGTAVALAGESGSALFDGAGRLLSFVSDDGSDFQFDPGNGAGSPVSIRFDPGAAGTADGLSQFAFDSTAAITSQDGYAMGFLDMIDIAPDGIVNGVFTNGTTQALARIVLVDFNNPGGLLRSRDGLYVPTESAGTAVVGLAGVDRGRTISAGALESSNVDLATELATMIIAQRGFQANARTITTSDEMLTEVINLKR